MRRQSQSQSWRRRVWRNFKFYIVGFAVVVVASLVSTGLEMLPGLFPDIHPLNQLATDLSGITLGGIIMVLGFMRDSRLEEARERTEAAEAETKAETPGPQSKRRWRLPKRRRRRLRRPSRRRRPRPSGSRSGRSGPRRSWRGGSTTRNGRRYWRGCGGWRNATASAGGTAGRAPAARCSTMRTPSQSQSWRRRVWRNFKFYIVGFAVVVVASLVSTGLGMLPGLFPDIHPLNQLATDLSGITLGGIIMVLGFMRDSRLEEARERTEAAEAETQAALAAVKTAQEATKAAEKAAADTVKASEKAAADAVKASEKAAADAIKAAEAEAKRQQERAEQQQQRAEQQRERAERAEAELARRAYDAAQAEILARLRRLEERYGIGGGDGGGSGG